MHTRLRFYATHAFPAAALAGLLLLLERTSIDLAASNLFYDPGAHEFPWRHHAFLEVVLHQWTKYLVIMIAVLAGAGYLLSLFVAGMRRWRTLYLFTLLSLCLAPLTVAALKQMSARHCPWSLELYGGFAPHFTLFDRVPAGLTAGHCFPAGHASTGFCLFAFYFAARALGNLRLAYGSLALALFAGLGLGLVRIMQGAHFVSHVLWSGLICWLVITLLYATVFGANTRHTA